MIDLQNGEITIVGRITDASNATLLAHIDGEQVVYKPIAGERPLWDFPDGHLAYREYAAFLISEHLGFEIVPPTVLRDGPYGEGMVQLWIEPNAEIDVVEISQSTNVKIREMVLFDALINNGDRKFGHILPLDERNIYGCDHGVTFNVENKLRTVLWQWSGDTFTPHENEKIEIFKKVIVDSRYEALLTDAEIAAAISRADNLLSMGTFPEPSEDWPAIPWPPF